MRIKIKLIKGFNLQNNEVTGVVEIVGRKMTKAWIQEHLGKDTKLAEVCKCHPNEYGIEWVTTMYDEKGNNIHMEIYRNPERAMKDLPYYDYVTYLRA